MKRNDYIVKLAVILIRELWQKRVGIGYRAKKNIICRFYPSCSNYAILAFQKRGFLVGLYLTFKRILRCTPHNTESCIDFP